MLKIYDAENQILGRICSSIAKDLLNGYRVYVVNAEKAVVSGSKKFIIDKYLNRRRRGDPKKGPFFPRYADRIFRRTVRGMLPIKKNKGRMALKRLKVFISVPKELEKKANVFIKIKEADVKRLKCEYITLKELSLYLGAKK
ncbi:MAG: 50S ribosomal protein L13 [Candidatus Aenigmarchaeota archaeon]|nr:50S ribosomal protein L13 [Candidatus Aenigmarchaeota archaeon]MDW8149307.1 50S ribosomal protein L13 [Candidatus Aenigmarchaeota archaeon]